MKRLLFRCFNPLFKNGCDVFESFLVYSNSQEVFKNVSPYQIIVAEKENGDAIEIFRVMKPTISDYKGNQVCDEIVSFFANMGIIKSKRDKKYIWSRIGLLETA